MMLYWPESLQFEPGIKDIEEDWTEVSLVRSFLSSAISGERESDWTSVKCWAVSDLKLGLSKVKKDDNTIMVADPEMIKIITPTSQNWQNFSEVNIDLSQILRDPNEQFWHLAFMVDVISHLSA